MRNSKKKVLIGFVIVFCGIAFINNSFSQNDIKYSHSNSRPSILIVESDISTIKQSVSNSPSIKILHDVIINESNALLEVPCLKYSKTGHRLLDVSRECYRRVFYLSYSYIITGNESYAKRAEAEMLAVSAFIDWNPSHFLDVAEMTMGVAIGYDWLYSYLSDASKAIIGDAILRKGIRPSMDAKYNSWLNVSYNWNQVCNAGIMYGAMAIRDREPQLSKEIIDRSIKSVLLPMKVYEPDGTYPEGFMYWGYGTTNNVLLISAAEKYFKEEIFPMHETPGFFRSASYILNMVGPTGEYFNYSDARNRATLNSSIFWFAQKTQNIDLLWNEKKYITSDNQSLKADRWLPAAIIWGAGLKFEEANSPKSNFWVGHGVTPVCLMRSSWTDKNAVFLAFKGGSPSAGHAHMDVGSFVMEANGVRWASDFGMQEYHTLESKGIDLWNNKQNSSRWKVFRYNNLAHNTLAFNDSLQRVNGAAKIDHYSDKNDRMYATSDLSSLYDGQVKSAVRTVSLIENSYVQISDEIETLDVSTKVRWTMLTEAEPSIDQEKNTIILERDGKKLKLKVMASEKVVLKTWSTISSDDFNAPNQGKYLVGFEALLSEKNSSKFEISLIPLK